MFCEGRRGDVDKFEEVVLVFVLIKGIHLNVDTATTDRGTEVLGRGANKDKSRNMTVGFHGPSEGLLTDLGKRVRVVDEDPGPGFQGRVRRRGSHLTDKESHVVANGLDASVLIGRQNHTFFS